MSNRDAAVLVLVGAALMAAVNVITLLQATVLFAQVEEVGFAQRLVALTPTLLLAWAAAHVLWHRDRLAQRIFPEPSRAGAPADIAGWRELGLVLVATLVLLLGLPEFTTWGLDVLSEAAGRGSEWMAATGTPALSPRRSVPALLDVALAAVVLLNREAVAARLFATAEEPVDLARPLEDEPGPEGGASGDEPRGPSAGAE